MKTAFITGATGQDGSYLCELLLGKGYTVFGLSRRKATDDGTRNLKTIVDNPNFHMVSGNVTDASSMFRLIDSIEPDEVYHLAAQSYVADSWQNPMTTMNINAGGTLNVLEAIRIYIENPRHYVSPKLYIAGSSEQFGLVQETPQNEGTAFYPRSPYGISKIAGYWLGVNYRESHGLFVSNGILFNHESERRGYEFVTRKITDYVGQLYHARRGHYDIPKLKLGNLDAVRDWGYSPDYVEAMWLMLQQQKPEDYVISTGKHYSIKQLLMCAFAEIGANWTHYVETDEKLIRPAEVETLLGDSKYALDELGWQPKTSFQEMIKKMVANDIELRRPKYESSNKKETNV